MNNTQNLASHPFLRPSSDLLNGLSDQDVVWRNFGASLGSGEPKVGLSQLRVEGIKADEFQYHPWTVELTALLKDLYKVRKLNENHVFLVKGR